MEGKEQNTEEKNGENKVVKNYEATMKRLVAVMGGEQAFTSSKLLTGDLGAVVTELLKEKKEATAKEVKEGLSKLLEQHIALKKAVIEKRKELEKLESDKMKEFTDAANKLFSKIDGLAVLEKDYYDGLSAAAPDKTN